MFSFQLFNQMPIVGILRNYPAKAVERILSLYYEAGLTTIEVTMNTEGASDIIKNAVKSFGGKLNIGAGTVISLTDLHSAVDSGASFIVTPVVDEEVIKKSVELKIPIFPGAFTPTEINKAWQLGGSIIKVFPSTFFGPDYFKEVKAPLNKVKLMATGGVSSENLLEFFKKGADAVGMGGQLFPKELIQDERWDELFEGFLKIKSIYELYKSQNK